MMREFLVLVNYPFKGKEEKSFEASVLFGIRMEQFVSSLLKI